MVLLLTITFLLLLLLLIIMIVKKKLGSGFVVVSQRGSGLQGTIVTRLLGLRANLQHLFLTPQDKTEKIIVLLKEAVQKDGLQEIAGEETAKIT